MPTVLKRNSHTERMRVLGRSNAQLGRSRGGVAVALLVGLILRLAVFAIIDMPASAHDEPEYQRLTINLVEHHAYSYEEAAPFTPALARVPLQPIFMAAVYALDGHHWFPVRLAQIVMTLGTALLFYAVLARRNPHFAWVMLWAAMLCPAEAFVASRLMSDPLAAFCLMLAMCLPWLVNGRSKWAWTGVALGLLVLARDVYLLLIPLVALALLLPITKRVLQPHGWQPAALLVLASIVVIAPWTYRNYRASGHFIATSSGFKWLNIWAGTWEDPAHLWRGNPFNTPNLPYRSTQERQLAEQAFSPGFHDKESIFKPLALERLRSDPAGALKRSIRRYYMLWVGPRAPVVFKPTALRPGHRGFLLVKGSLFVLNAAIFVLSLVGIGIALRRRSWLWWFLVTIIYTGAVYFPLHDTEARFTQPVFLFLLAFALIPVWAVVRGEVPDFSMNTVTPTDAVEPRVTAA